MFCSDVVAFNAIFPSTRKRKRERASAWRRDETKAGTRFTPSKVGRFTQHFVEHCAILVCSSHSVNVGGVARGKKKKKILTLKEDDSSPERCFSFPVIG